MDGREKEEMRNIVCMGLCLAGLILLTTSDALINMSASSMMGSADSADSYKAVAIGVTIGLLALGSIAVVIGSTAAQWGLWAVTGLAAVFSGVLTVQAVSIDYAANDHAGAIGSATRAENRSKAKALKEERAMLRMKMKECARDNYFKPCSSTESRLTEISRELSAISDSTVASVKAQKVDITGAVEQKAGISAQVLERVMIYSRAIAVPLMMAILMSGFWIFWARCFGDVKVAVKKRFAAA